MQVLTSPEKAALCEYRLRSVDHDKNCHSSQVGGNEIGSTKYCLHEGKCKVVLVETISETSQEREGWDDLTGEGVFHPRG